VRSRAAEAGGPARQLAWTERVSAWVRPLPDRAGNDSVTVLLVARVVPLRNVNERLKLVARPSVVRRLQPRGIEQICLAFDVQLLHAAKPSVP
jgi:hypothetical protein